VRPVAAAGGDLQAVLADLDRLHAIFAARIHELLI